MTNSKRKLLCALSIFSLVTLSTFSRTQPVHGSSTMPAFKEGENSIIFIGCSDDAVQAMAMFGAKERIHISENGEKYFFG